MKQLYVHNIQERINIFFRISTGPLSIRIRNHSSCLVKYLLNEYIVGQSSYIIFKENKTFLCKTKIPAFQGTRPNLSFYDMLSETEDIVWPYNTVNT